MQAALDPLPQVIAQPGVARQARQPGLSGALDHRRVPAQMAQHGNRLGGLRRLAVGGDERLHDRVEGVMDDVPEQCGEGGDPRVAAAVPQVRVAGAGQRVPARAGPTSRREEKLHSGGGPGRIAADDSIPVSSRRGPVIRAPR